MKLVSFLTAIVAFAGLAAAQPCGTLAVSGGPTTPVVFTASNLADSAPALLVIGETTGSTTINLGPIGSLTLGLALPFVPLPLGMTSSSGGATLTINVPPRLPPLSLHAQAFSVEFTLNPPRLTFCTTNVVPFSIGA